MLLSFPQLSSLKRADSQGRTPDKVYHDLQSNPSPISKTNHCTFLQDNPATGRDREYRNSRSSGSAKPSQPAPWLPGLSAERLPAPAGHGLYYQRQDWRL